MVEAGKEDNDAHVDVLLCEYLDEAGPLFFDFGMFLLELSKVLEKACHEFVYEDSAARYEEQE